MYAMRLTTFGKVIISILTALILALLVFITRGMGYGSTAEAKSEISNFQNDENSFNIDGKNKVMLLSNTIEMNNIKIGVRDIKLSIFFDPDNAQIKREYFESLNLFAAVAELFGGAEVVIEGNTADISNGKDPDYDRKLSLMRAESAASYLKGRGMDVKRVMLIGNGHEKPLGDNGIGAGRRLNRRVDIYFKQ